MRLTLLHCGVLAVLHRGAKSLAEINVACGRENRPRTCMGLRRSIFKLERHGLIERTNPPGQPSPYQLTALGTVAAEEWLAQCKATVGAICKPLVFKPRTVLCFKVESLGKPLTPSETAARESRLAAQVADAAELPASGFCYVPGSLRINGQPVGVA